LFSFFSLLLSYFLSLSHFFFLFVLFLIPIFHFVCRSVFWFLCSSLTMKCGTPHKQKQFKTQTNHQIFFLFSFSLVVFPQHVSLLL
jgi:hypothetical protein